MDLTSNPGTLDASPNWPALCFGLAVASLVVVPLARILYNVFLHPLASYPGPWLWRATSLPMDYYAFRGRLPGQIVKLHQKFGKEVRIAPDALSFSDGQAWKDVYNAKPEFPKDPRKITIPVNGVHSILGAPKDQHARYRRLLSHAFSEKGLREQEPRIKRYVNLLVQRLSEAASARTSVNMVDMYTMVVFDVIGDLAWGESFHELEENRVHDWVPAILGNLKYVMQNVIFRKYGLEKFTPYLTSPEAVEGRKQNFALSAKLADKRADMGSEPRGDFWDRVLIKSKDDNATGEGMTRPEMVVNASVLVLGGAETSATTLSGTTHLLCQHPDVLKKVTQEVRSAFESTDEIDALSVSRLTYMLAVIDEAMRIYPPVPDQMQRTPPQGGGMVCGKWIPETTSIHVHQLALNHMPCNFHRPEDFVPERWLANPPAEFANDDRYAFQPFSVGTRNCIGRNLAYAELRLVLAKVLYHFDMELDKVKTKKDWFDQDSWAVWFKEPLYIKLRQAGQ